MIIFITEEGGHSWLPRRVCMVGDFGNYNTSIKAHGNVNCDYFLSHGVFGQRYLYLACLLFYFLGRAVILIVVTLKRVGGVDMSYKFP